LGAGSSRHQIGRQAENTRDAKYDAEYQVGPPDLAEFQEPAKAPSWAYYQQLGQPGEALGKGQRHAVSQRFT
jgi:hypothetical protein